MPTVLLTRPEQDSNALAVILAEQGISSIISPVITIKYLQIPPLHTPFDAIILTSRHALPATAGLTAPCYVVGEQTARAAEALGLHVIKQTKNAEELAQLLPSGKTFFYPSGEHISHDFPHAIRVVAYSAEASTALSEEAIEAIRRQRLKGVVLFSARSARIFCDLLMQHELQTAAQQLNAYCLSDAVAQHCAKVAWKHIYTAQAPTQQSMVELLKTAQ